ncbi:MAG: hypothetical protein PF574_01965 [Candidatus Delongbacteria bacterium]|nr:hypothetical protein [Candidatus Delongbacteria bacterium]
MTKREKEKIDAIAGAALNATLQAIKNAKKTKVPMIVKKNNVLYEINQDGTMRKIKDLPKRTNIIPPKFILE